MAARITAPRFLAGGVMGVALAVVSVAGLAADGEPSAAPAAGESLHATIDRIVSEAAVGPCAPRCSDADFVRRIHLDLVGVIPGAARVQAFLADQSPDKRERLVDELLAERGFARHMMFIIDAMFLERATPPGDLAAAWREHLYRAFAEDRPLDVLLREFLAADGGDVTTRPAAAFTLAREAEPVRLTRAIGRLFFGRDLQCAQCHDHPLDDDIRQSEHQGLYAFVARTSLFKGKDNLLFVSEKADGDVDYQSVFTQQGERGVWPRLPGGLTLVDEPRLEPTAAYTEEPTKTSRGVPAFSRRKALAAGLVEDERFRRNLANRIWAVFFGRGLVHPLDGMVPDNPPTHPRLLVALADALRAQGFKLRPIVREIVLTEAYQRAIEPPRPEDVDLAALDQLVVRLEAERAALAAAVPELRQAVEVSTARRDAIAGVSRKVHEERLALVAKRDAEGKSAAVVAAAAAKTLAGLEQARSVAEAIGAAAARAAEAASVVAGDAAVAEVAGVLQERARAKAAVADAANRDHAEKRAAAEAAAAALAAARQAVEAATGRLDAASLAAAERAAFVARLAAEDAAQRLRRAEERLDLARDLATHAQLRSEQPAAATSAWESIVERWTAAGQVAPLRGLSAEQLALSVQQATGALSALHAGAVAAIAKEPPEAVVKASDDERADVQATQVELRLVRDTSGLVRATAALYGDVMSEGFQASISQALFFGNAPDIQSQLGPTGSGLVATLAAAGDLGSLADAAYLSVLSRLPTDAERADVTSFLAPRESDKNQALAELVWALLSSNEFRFNH